MNKTAIFGILLALILPLGAYMLMKNLSRSAVVMPGHYIYDSVAVGVVDGKKKVDTIWHRLPDFSFTNQLGQTVKLSDIDSNKVIVADFFFTRCPTICPRMTEHMKKLQTGITNAQRVQRTQFRYVHYLSFSIDPERDGVPELKAWADRFGINPENWWLLTGPKKEIYDYSINQMKLGVIDGAGVDTSFYHTDYMVLIDRNRNIRGYYHGLDTTAIEKLSSDLVLLSLEKDPRRKKFWEGKLELYAIVFAVALLGLVALFYFLKKEKV